MNSSFKPLPPETVQNPASPVDTQTRSRRRRAALRSLCNLPFLLPPLGVRAGLRMNSQPMPSKKVDADRQQIDLEGGILP